jgi:drug/metabolite transporter (DMT)-like permease
VIRDKGSKIVSFFQHERMIQRIQSIFLLLAAVGFLILYKLPFATSDASIPTLLEDKMYNVTDHVILIVLSALGGLLSLATIFLFNNRILQLKMSNILIILSILLPLVAFLLIYNEGTAMVEDANIQDEAGLYILAVNLVTTFLASHFIKKDQKLVSSMDRLR